MLLNRPRATEYMRRFGLDALVATSPVNVTYFSGYSCWIDTQFKEYMMSPGASADLLPGAYTVLPLDGEPALLVGSVTAVNAVDGWIQDIHLFGDFALDLSQGMRPIETVPNLGRLLLSERAGSSPVDVLLAVLNLRGLADARIGVDFEGLSAASRERIRDKLSKAEVKDCSNLIRLIRMVKSDEEISRMRRAAQISEDAAMATLKEARPGSSLADLAAAFRIKLAYEGADLDHFAFGFRGMGIATEPRYELRDDDILYIDYGCKYGYYFSDTGTTLAMRELPRMLQQKHDALLACIAAGREAIRPGARASSVRRAMWETLNDSGVAESFPHGHGLGLEARDYPILVDDNGRRIQDDCVDVPSDLLLESDMVLNLESAIFLPEVASLHIEQSFVVTQEGNDCLVEQNRLPVHPGV